MKRCSRCKEWKDENEFYKDKHTRDGLTYKCANCMKKTSHEYCNSEHGKQIRQEYNESERRKQTRNKYKTSEKGKQKQNIWNKTPRGRAIREHYCEKFPEKVKARRKVQTAVHSNTLPHPSTQSCANCGKKAEQYHHHQGYSEEHWLDVIPLCRNCHID